MQSGRMYLLVYVDDILIAARSKADVDEVKRELLTKFEGTDLGEAHFFLAWTSRETELPGPSS